MEWIPVSKALPVIPVGKFGIQVLVAEFDACFDEIKPGSGYSVHSANYCYTYGRNGKTMPLYEGTGITEDFMTLEYCMDGSNEPTWGPIGEPVTHWMYMPEPPEYNGDDLNPIFQWYFDNAVPNTQELKVIGNSEDNLKR